MKTLLAILSVALSGCASTSEEPVVYFCDPSPPEVVSSVSADAPAVSATQEAGAAVESEQPGGCGG